MRFLITVVMSLFFVFGLHADQLSLSDRLLALERSRDLGAADNKMLHSNFEVWRQFFLEQEKKIVGQALQISVLQKQVENVALLQAQMDDMKAWRAGLERTVRLGSLVFLWHFVLAPVLYTGKRKKTEQGSEHVGVPKKLKKSKKLTQKLSIALKRIMTHNKITALLGAATAASAAHLMIRGN